MDVCTILSGITEAEGLSQGWSLDLTRADAQGRVWDFDKAAFRVRCRKLVETSELLLLIGSPMCIRVSTLQSVKNGEVDPGE